MEDRYYGGVLLNDQYILTAATNGFGKAHEYTVRIGAYNRKDEDDGIMDIDVAEIMKLPTSTWNHESMVNTLINDMALLKLASPVTFDDNVSPICLPADDSNTYAGSKATVTGWGILGWSPPKTCVYANTGPLFQVELDVLEDGDCGNWNSNSYIDVKNMVCAEAEGKGACSGDGGGKQCTHVHNWVVPDYLRNCKALWGCFLLP